MGKKVRTSNKFRSTYSTGISERLEPFWEAGIGQLYDWSHGNRECSEDFEYHIRFGGIYRRREEFRGLSCPFPSSSQMVMRREGR
jgi:hypothetical protein